MSVSWKRGLELFLIVVVFLIDQGSKLWAQQRDMAILNKGGVFGILPSGAWIIVLGVILVFVVREWWQMKHGLERVGMALLIGGGVGNIADRLIFGAVRDFIYYPWFGVYGNVADIVLGVGVMIVIIDRLLPVYET